MAEPDDVERLDLSAVSTRLDELVLSTRAEPADALLARARSLVARLRNVAAMPADAADGTGWQATRIVLASGEVTATCRNESMNATLVGQWLGDRLVFLWLEVGERYWGSRDTPRGESRLGSDENVAGPADGRFFANLEQRARDAMRQWKQKTARDRWVCASCSWQNESGDTTCRICGLLPPIAPAPAPEPSTKPAPPSPRTEPALPRPIDLDSTFVQTPASAGVDDTFVATQISAPLSDRPAARRELDLPPPPTGLRFEVLLLRFPPRSRAAVEDTLRESRRAGGDPAVDPALLDRVNEGHPVLAGRRLAIGAARDLCDRLESLGAAVEMRKDRS